MWPSTRSGHENSVVRPKDSGGMGFHRVSFPPVPPEDMVRA